MWCVACKLWRGFSLTLLSLENKSSPPIASLSISLSEAPSCVGSSFTAFKVSCLQLDSALLSFAGSVCGGASGFQCTASNIRTSLLVDHCRLILEFCPLRMQMKDCIGFRSRPKRMNWWIPNVGRGKWVGW